MKLFITATAALIATSGLGATVLRTGGPQPMADLCVVQPTAVSQICVSHLCVGWDVNGTNPLPITDPQCPPTPLPNDCNLNVPPTISDIDTCLPPIAP